jgi:hypothetical protein
MKFNWEEKIGGLDRRELRDFLKKFQKQNVLAPYYVRRRLRRAHVDSLSSAEYRAIDQREGMAAYLERYEKEEFQKYIAALELGGFVIENGEQYDLTELAYRLIKAKMKRHTRAAAQRQLERFVARCRTANASYDFSDAACLLKIDELAVFGSFLDQKGEEVGDVDVYINASLKKEALAYLRSRGINGTDLLNIFDKALGKLRKGLNIIDLCPSKDGLRGVMFKKIPL